MQEYVHYLPGGGLGDVCREAYYHNAVGILRKWKLEHPDAHLTVVLMSHNPGSADLLARMPWLDVVTQRHFPLEQTWAWEAVYDLYPADFATKTELRWVMNDPMSLYRPDMSLRRPRLGAVQLIQPIGCAMDIPLSSAERTTVARLAGRPILHPCAGETYKWMPPELVERLTQHAEQPLIVGATYDRIGHAPEAGDVLPPRVLLSLVRKAPLVIGAESSVYYMATMSGTPSAMFYPPDAPYARWRRGLAGWNWYYGLNDPRHLQIQTPVSDADWARFATWYDTQYWGNNDE